MAKEDPGRIWEDLLVELQDSIMSFLDTNEVLCTIRLICKAAAARYPGPRHTRIRLSQPVPTHAFAHRWGRPEAMRSLSYTERKQLLCLTAASGSIPNLQLLLPIVGCTWNSGMFRAAASAGRLATCQWLRQQGCMWDDVVLEAAGRSGSRALCDWLIAAGCPGGAQHALQGAASAGHVGLVDQLLASYGPPGYPAEVLAGAATGCDLPTLRRLHAALVPDAGELADWLEEEYLDSMAAAVSSLTADWRDKLEWLVSRGFSPSHLASYNASSCPDALDRLAWLAQHGFEVQPGYVAPQAADRGNMELLVFALEEPGRRGGPNAEAEVRKLESWAVDAAAEGGQLAVLQYLHGRGCSMGPAIRCAASRGHLHVVAWLVETLGAGAVLSEEVFKAAARSGSLPLLTWLRGRGCVCRDAAVMDEALKLGASEDVLDWLQRLACSVELSAEHWHKPARRGDLATLAWLRRMGCPWAADGSTFTEAVRRHYPVKEHSPLPALRWLAEAGCPVDWEVALKWARARWYDREAVAGLEALRGQHT